jgi:malic enzyme
VVVSGAGAAGVAVAKLLGRAGVTDVVVCDSRGILSPARSDLAEHKRRLAATTNPRGLSGSLGEALVGTDVFVGVSGGQVAEADIARMAKDSIIFALANPDPEVDPSVAAKYAAVVATGRSDYPNQINNVLAFPGIFRGALDSGAPRITEPMKLAAASAITGPVESPTAEEIVPQRLPRRSRRRRRSRRGTSRLTFSVLSRSCHGQRPVRARVLDGQEQVHWVGRRGFELESRVEGSCIVVQRVHEQRPNADDLGGLTQRSMASRRRVPVQGWRLAERR